jgi:hypothetical protein
MLQHQSFDPFREYWWGVVRMRASSVDVSKFPAYLLMILVHHSSALISDLLYRFCMPSVLRPTELTCFWDYLLPVVVVWPSFPFCLVLLEFCVMFQISVSQVKGVWVAALSTFGSHNLSLHVETKFCEKIFTHCTNSLCSIKSVRWLILSYLHLYRSFSCPPMRRADRALLFPFNHCNKHKSAVYYYTALIAYCYKCSFNHVLALHVYYYHHIEILTQEADIFLLTYIIFHSMHFHCLSLYTYDKPLALCPSGLPSYLISRISIQQWLSYIFT